MAQKGKTTVWLFSSTKESLVQYKRGESWDAFLLRISDELSKAKVRRMKVEAEGEPDGDRKPIWLNEGTRDVLRDLLKPDETWGNFFHRVDRTLEAIAFPKNPN